MSDRPAVLLSDANVLIDYRDSDLSILELVVQHIAPVHVVREVLDEAGISLERCRELGLTVIDVDVEVLLGLAGLSRRLSRHDRLSFHVCRENDWICLTNDRALRRICGENNVRVQWGLEVMLDLVAANALTRSRALTVARQIRATSRGHITEEILTRFESRIEEIK